MSLWSWVLVALAAAGIVLVAAGCARALIIGLRVQRRISALAESPLITKIESLQIQLDRISRSSEEIAVLRTRAEAALAEMKKSLTLADTIREAARAWGGELRSIVRDLS